MSQNICDSLFFPRRTWYFGAISKSPIMSYQATRSPLIKPQPSAGMAEPSGISNMTSLATIGQLARAVLDSGADNVSVLAVARAGY